MEIKESGIANRSPHMERLQNFFGKYKDALALFAASRVFYAFVLIYFQGYLSAINLFDGELYVRIAKYGYETISLTAFFPVIPILIRCIGVVGVLIINQICFFLSLVILKKLGMKTTVIATLAFSPIGFFSMLLYTESLFFFLTLLSYYLYVNGKKPLFLGIVLGLSVATRSTGSLLFFAIFIAMAFKWVRKETKLSSIIITYVPATIISLMYPIYLQIKFGNWKSFVDVQYDYWIRINSNFFKTTFFSLQYLFTNEFEFQNFGDMLLSRTNEFLSLVLAGLLLFLAFSSIAKMLKKHQINFDELVLSVYILLIVIVITGTIRDPKLDAPTISFFRYYYGVISLYLLSDTHKARFQEITMFFTIFVTLITSVIFTMGVFFY